MKQDKSAPADAASRLRGLLPDGWKLDHERPPGGPDTWTVSAPDGRAATVVLSFLDTPSPRIIARKSRTMRDIVVARFLSPATRARLEAQGCDFADSTGNVCICLPSPGLVIRTHGADRDPHPRTMPERTLRGSRAARLVRVLCDASLPLTLTEAGRRARIDLGYASRLLDWLGHEGFVTRARRGPVTHVDVPGVLARWADSYSALRTHDATGFRDPSAAAGVPDRMKALPSRYAITGTFAANRLAVFAPRRPMLVYAERPRDLVTSLGLVATDADPDVIVMAPSDEFVFDRTWRTGGLTFASPSQIAIDLLTGPEDGRAFADDVIAWMLRRRQ